MKRPLLMIGFVYFLSAVAALLFGSNFSAAVGGVLILTVVISSFLVHKKWRNTTIILLLTVIFSLANVIVRDLLQVRPILEFQDHTVLLSGRVTKIQYANDSGKYLLDAKIPTKEGKVLRTNVQVYSFTPLPVSINEEIQGYITLFDPKLNFRGQCNALADGILLYGNVFEDVKILTKNQVQKDSGYYISELQEILKRQNEKLLPVKEAALLNAMLFGDKNYLDEDVYLDFQQAGIIHLMAVSGFHITLITALFGGVLRFFGICGRLNSLLTTPFLILFMAVSGFTPSVLRAGLMMGVFLLGQLAGKQYDPLSAYGFSLLIICFLNPFSALDIGFLLSYASSGGILLIAPKWSDIISRKLFANHLKKSRFAFPIIKAFTVSTSAFVFALPFMLFYFNSFSFVAPFASSIAMPLASVLLWNAAISLLLSFIPFASIFTGFLSKITVFLAGFLSQVANGFASLPFSTISLQYESVKILIAIFCVMLLFLSLFKMERFIRRLIIYFSIAAISICWVTSFWFNQGTIQVVMFDEINAALVIRGRQAALCGFPEKSYAGRKIAYYLKGKGIHRLEFALSTDISNDNTSGAAELFSKVPSAMTVMPNEGRYTPFLVRYTRKDYSIVRPSKENGEYTAVGCTFTSIPCTCGSACKIQIGDQSLLKLNEKCVIMITDSTTQGVIKGSTLVKLKTGTKIKISYDGDGMTIYNFRESRKEAKD